MGPQVIIISSEDEHLLKNLIDELIYHEFASLKLIYDGYKLIEQLSHGFKGFIIFCLPPGKLIHWIPFIRKRLLNYFKIYYYHSLIEENVDTSIYANFDYLIAGETKNGILSHQLSFLKMNYWRKIPLLHLGIQQSQISKLIKKIIYTIEKSDISVMTLEHISSKLNISPEVIRQELKNKLNMHYTELKNSLIDYYRKNYPDEFV
jgi:hypothetical protein